MIFSFQSLPIVPRRFQPSVSCPLCAKPNDCDFRFCKRCGYQRHKRVSQASPHFKAPVDLSVISARKQCLVTRQRSTPYQKQKTALEVEFMDFLGFTSQRDMCTAIPDVVDFLIWKDSFGKTVVHCDTCPFFGERSNSSFSCPKHLAYGSVDSAIGKLRAIFNKYGRAVIYCPFLGLANPAASPEVKPYLSAIREEQLVARVVPKQAGTFFFRDLVILSSEIIRIMNTHLRSPSQLYILVRNQAFFKIQFFGGDRAGTWVRYERRRFCTFRTTRACCSTTP